jgi:hypothetical protein
VQVLLRPHSHALEALLNSSATQHGAPRPGGYGFEAARHHILSENLLSEVLEFSDAIFAMSLREVLSRPALRLDETHKPIRPPVKQGCEPEFESLPKRHSVRITARQPIDQKQKVLGKILVANFVLL